MIGDWGKGWEIQVQPVAVQSKPKRMQEEDVGTKSLYIPPIRPLSRTMHSSILDREKDTTILHNGAGLRLGEILRGMKER